MSETAKAIEIIYKVWQSFRRIIYPKRLYRYGSISISQGYITDDRNIIEKVCDRVDDILFNYINEKRNRQARKSMKYFSSFFDWSLGVNINSYSDIKRIEKERGMTYGDVKDVEKLANIKEQRRAELHEKKIAEKLEHVIADIKNGRKFSLENRLHREKCIKNMRGY